MYEKITDNLQADQMNYIFLDEIQMVPEFERVLDSLFIKENVDLY
ncbi:MAG: AAA family ATPase, partial [Lactococcus raffinolactis]